MTFKKTLVGTAVIACLTSSPLVLAADAKEVAREFIDNSFHPGPGQDLSRLEQDKTMEQCTAVRDKPDSKLSKEIMEREAGTIKYPENGEMLGDWKSGEKLVNTGFAMRIGNFAADNPKKARGGNCYACHAIDRKEVAAGNLGPSLTDYGKRGTGEAMVKYTYNKIYNPHASMACSQMPRLGHNGVLTPEQIADITAYLLLPESSLNSN